MRRLSFVAVLGLLIFTPVLLSSSCEEVKNESVVSPSAQSTSRIIVDVRTVGEFSNGAIDGAVNIPLNELESRMDEIRNFEEIVVYCASGARSSQAKLIIENAGHKNVINGGGIQQMKQNQN